MSSQMQMRNQAVPLDFNNLGGATQDNNFSQTYNNNYNKMNSMNGYPRGSYINENNNNNANNNYRQNDFNNQNRINENFPEQNQQNFSNTYSNNNYNQSMNNNFSQSMNQANNYRSLSPRQIRLEEQEKKKVLLNNIQSQINLNRQTKLEQMNKNREEDAKYLRDMMVHFPFGRGGGGAPIRDKSGNIITNRRALISDPKYNLASINVDDDYYEVWNKEKRIGRYYNNNNNDINNNMNGNNNYSQQLSNTAKNFRGMQYNNNNNNNNNYQDPYYNNNQNYFNENNNYQQNMGRPYSTNPRIMNNNNNFNNYNNNYNNNGQNMDYYPEEENNLYQNQNNNINNNNYQNNNQFANTLQRPNTQTISLTYDNFEVMNNEQQRQIKENYRQDLLDQIKEREERKKLEKKRKKEEEEKEEERLRKEREEMYLQEQEEKNKNKQKLNNIRNENGLLMQERRNNNNNEEFNNLRGQKRILKSNVQTDENNNIIEKEAFDRIHQKEVESKMQLNNEIMKLREQMKDQQNDLFNQIAFLKQETQNANQQRFEALKEIDKLKDELSKQRNDEILRRKYVYDVVVNEAQDANNIVQESHLPKNDKPKVVLPVDNEKDIYYEERIRHPNRVIPVPKLTELNEHGVKTDSKFIDIDTHNLVSGLELYEPNNKLISSEDEDYKINNRGIGIEGDYGTLRGNGNIMRTSDVLMPSSNDLSSNQVNISINNKKINTFKNIKNVETFKDGNTDNININLESIDDSNFEVNKIYNKNLERLRYLNDMENNFTPKKNYDILKNNVVEKDNFDEFIKKLNKPVPPVPTENDEEFEIEVSKVRK